MMSHLQAANEIVNGDAKAISVRSANQGTNVTVVFANTDGTYTRVLIESVDADAYPRTLVGE